MSQRVFTAAFATALVGLLTPTSLRAHEGHAHKYMGKVVSVQAQQIEVETKDGTKVAAPLTADTKYLRGKTAAAFADVKVGERVVIVVVEEKVGEQKVKKVTEVLLGEAAAPAKSQPH
jgi:hypothetical protein